MSCRYLPRLVLLGAVLGWAASSAVAADLRVEPAEVTLTGPHARQRPLVLEEQAGRVVGDRTAQARFTSSDVKVAAVAPDGTVRAVGDGQATVTAHLGRRSAAVQVTVGKVKGPFAWGFRNHVIPLLTRA